MDHLEIYDQQEILLHTKHRSLEIKIGEMVQTISDPAAWESELIKSSAKFVLLGLPEDIGVRANYGRGGAWAAWQPAFHFFINMQSNEFLKGDEILVLGHIDFTDLMEKANQLNYKSETEIGKARELVIEIDSRVAHIISKIAEADKIPIVIGGGHNNAYPIIKGICSGKKFKAGMNVINCDAHSDMRPMNGRHSGNGFHYAFHENLLNKYAVFGLHESYNIHSALQLFNQNPSRLLFETYDDIFVRESINYFDALKNCMEFCGDELTGIEIDMDSIQNIPVSARTPSGMLPADVRKFVWHCAENLNTAYLHIAEAAPPLAHKQMDNKTGKLIAYLMTDFIKSINNKPHV